MKAISLLTTVVTYALISCLNPISKKNLSTTLIDQNGMTVSERFLTPDNFERLKSPIRSFGTHLSSLPLRHADSKVNYFNGDKKTSQGVYCAVVDLDIGKRDLHQCADAVMRLRADFLYSQHQHNKIAFNFTNGFKAEYSRWKNGDRISVNGNKVSWKTNAAAADDGYETYWKYLEMVFSYAGTASLEKELKPKSLSELEIGDVFIQGGFPGHAIIVIDVCQHETTGEKLFMLAQSYMPAQQIQVLINPNNSDLSPWYAADFDGELITPEWRFKASDLKGF